MTDDAELKSLAHVSPFERGDAPKARNFYQRLVRRRYPERANQALHNLLAGREPRTIEMSEVWDALGEFGLSGKAARQLCGHIWGQGLTALAAKGPLAEPERTYMTSLGRLLGLTEEETEEAVKRVAEKHYKLSVEVALADGHRSEPEKESLARISTELGLGSERMTALYGEVALPLYQKRYDAVVADRRVSPFERKQLEDMAANLGITVNFEPDAKVQFDYYAELWDIENGKVPAIPVSIKLQKGEVAHWSGPVQWYELRTQTVRRGYHGVSTSIRIMKGLSYRIGSYAPSRVTEEALTHIDSGTLYITSKRLIFDGEKKNTSIRYSAVLGTEVYSNAISIEKATGRSPMLMMHQGTTEKPAVILSAALASSD